MVLILQWARLVLLLVNGLVDKQNIAINTPTAQITIRGTDFTSTVDESEDLL